MIKKDTLDPHLIFHMASVLCNDLDAREIAGQIDAPLFADSEDHVRDYWFAIARAAIEATPDPAIQERVVELEAERDAWRLSCGNARNALDSVLGYCRNIRIGLETGDSKVIARKRLSDMDAYVTAALTKGAAQ